MKMIAMALLMSLGMAQQAFSMNLPTCEQARQNNDTRRLTLQIVITEWERIGKELKIIDARMARLQQAQQAGKISEDQSFQEAGKLTHAQARLRTEAQMVSRIGQCAKN